MAGNVCNVICQPRITRALHFLNPFLFHMPTRIPLILTSQVPTHPIVLTPHPLFLDLQPQYLQMCTIQIRPQAKQKNLRAQGNPSSATYSID